MRALILTLALCGCTPASPPEAEIAREIAIAPATMICSESGEEAIVYTLSTGEELAPMPSGRACDYDAFTQYRLKHGRNPPAPWRHLDYQLWRRTHPEA